MEVQISTVGYFFNIKAIKTFLSVKQLENFYYKKIKKQIIREFFVSFKCICYEYMRKIH